MVPIGVAAVNNVGGDYIDCSTTKVKNVVNQDNPKGVTLDRLFGHIASGALHDSADRGPFAPKCHPETRKAVQQDIMGWIRHGDQDEAPKKIMFLSGPAGSGKTAIMGTIADECHREGLLAASFFFSAFSQLVNRRSKGPFILTLAYGLLQQKPITNLRAAILSAIEEDPAVFDKHLEQQLDQLILTPLRVVMRQSDSSRWPKIIIVDGVDECGGDDAIQGSESALQKSREENHREILRVLARAVADPVFPFRVLVASRPEPAITGFFKSQPNAPLHIFLDSQYDPDSDIRLFLKAKLGAIQREFGLSCHWPPQHDIDLLVDRASGQFIYAATVIRFVEDLRRPPQEQLALVVNWAQRDKPDSNPFASLDSLYTSILNMSPDPALAGKWIVCLNEDWQCLVDVLHGSVRRQLGSGWYKKAILESSSGETVYLLGRLPSLVSISEDSEDFKIILYHKSLLDFLGDASRSNKLHVSEMAMEQYIKDCHYHTLKSRGFRCMLDEQSDHDLLIRDFVVFFPRYIDPFRRYDIQDFAWWWAQASKFQLLPTEYNKSFSIKYLFFEIDEKCSRYRCLPSCKLFRQAIRQQCKADGWPELPTRIDFLRAKVHKWLSVHYKYISSPLWNRFDDIRHTRMTA